MTPPAGQDSFYALTDMGALRDFCDRLATGLPTGRPGLKLDVTLQDAAGLRIHSSEQTAETLGFIVDATVTIGEAVLAQAAVKR